MNIRRTVTSALVLALIALPLSAAAQTSDEIIADLLRTLDGTTPIRVVATTTATTTAPKPAPKPVSFSTAVAPPANQPILGPLFVFGIDNNVPHVDPQISGLQGTVDLLMVQLAALKAPTAASTAATSTATTTPPTPQKKLFTRDLTIGSRGEDVSRLQTLLIAQGFLFGEVTGYFGILTKTAVIAFQTEHALPPVGNVGPRTRAVLNDMPTEPGQESVQLIIGPPARPFIASSTSATLSASSTATSTSGMASTSASFDPFYPPVSVFMSVLPSEAPVGGSAAVTWISQNATSCQASDGWDGPKATLGAARIDPLQFTLNLVLTCTGPGGIASTTAVIVVGGEQ